MTLRNIGLGAFAFTSLLTFAGCQTGPKPEDKKDIAADTAAISALREKFTTAFNSNDAAALAALYADDAIVMPIDRPSVEGRPAVQSLFEAMFKANAGKIAITPQETQVAGDWAYERGNVTTTMTPNSGKPIEESFKYLIVLKRLPGSLWKIYRDIDNRNGPAPAAAPAKKAGRKAGKKGGKR